jgi:N-acetylmuramoyl-L-alanine amidase
MTLLEGILWLTLNVYHEARGESVQGQMAVVHVTLNRAKRRNMSIKEVVLEHKQFSWTLMPKSKWKPKDKKAYKQCMEVVKKAVKQKDFTNGATFFHSKKVHPKWRKQMKYVGTYGNHKFYKKRG